MLFTLAGSVKAQNSSDETIIEKVDFLIENSRFSEALIMVENAIRLTPETPSLYVKKSHILSHLGRFNEAISNLEHPSIVNCQYFYAYEVKANLYTNISRYPEALVALDMAFKYDTDIQRKYHYKLKSLDILETIGGYGAMKSHIDDAKKIVGNTFELLYFESIYLNASQDYEKAYGVSKLMCKELEKIPGTEKYFYQFLLASLHTDHFSDIKDWFESSPVIENPAQFELFKAPFHYKVALAYTQIMEYDKASIALKRCLELSPTFSSALDLQKDLYVISTPKERIIIMMEKSIATEKNDAEKVKKLWEVFSLYYQAKQYQESDRILRLLSSLSIDSLRDPRYLLSAAMTDYKLNRFSESLEFLSRAGKNPNLSPAIRAKLIFAEGVIHKASKNYTASEACFKNAMIDPYREAIRYEMLLTSYLRSFTENISQ